MLKRILAAFAVLVMAFTGTAVLASTASAAEGSAAANVGHDHRSTQWVYDDTFFEDEYDKCMRVGARRMDEQGWLDYDCWQRPTGWWDLYKLVPARRHHHPLIGVDLDVDLDLNLGVGIGVGRH